LLLTDAVRLLRARHGVIVGFALVPVLALVTDILASPSGWVAWSLVALAVTSAVIVLLLRFTFRCPRCGIPLKHRIDRWATIVMRSSASEQVAYCTSCGWQVREGESLTFGTDPGGYEKKQQRQKSDWQPEVLDFLRHMDAPENRVSVLGFLRWWELESDHGRRKVPGDFSDQMTIANEYLSENGVNPFRSVSGT
jgi:predicted RNA-binding Zn-ribbon protein involved in translation (DUF1610 family)